VRGRLRKEAKREEPPVRVVSTPAPRERNATPRPQVAQAPTPAAYPRRPAAEAWAQLAAPLARNEGTRILFFGVTGWGKTTGIEDFLHYIERFQLADLILIHDVKKPEKQYEGEVIHEAREVQGERAPELPARRVLRRRSLDHMPSVEDAARVTLESGYSGVSTIFVIDEFQRALTDGGTFEAPHVRRLFNEGLGLHASIFAAKQLPQNVPTEATGQATKVYFHMSREGTNFLQNGKKISDDEANLMCSLELGEFIVFPDAGDFDGYVYKVPPP